MSWELVGQIGALAVIGLVVVFVGAGIVYGIIKTILESKGENK